MLDPCNRITLFENQLTFYIKPLSVFHKLLVTLWLSVICVHITYQHSTSNLIIHIMWEMVLTTVDADMLLKSISMKLFCRNVFFRFQRENWEYWVELCYGYIILAKPYLAIRMLWLHSWDYIVISKTPTKGKPKQLFDLTCDLFSSW